TQIKGVGRWTTEMLLMFALCREDVFAPDDLGLQQAVIGLYNLRHRKKKIMMARIVKIAEQWSPYRTYASMYLWRWKDNPPLKESKKKGRSGNGESLLLMDEGWVCMVERLDPEQISWYKHQIES